MRLRNQIIKLNDGRNLGYAEYGDPDGKPLIHFHGWPSSRFSGLRFEKAAKKLQARIITVDRPGYGLSDFKESRTLLDWPDDVSELANKLKIGKFSIMGISGGGPYAAVCAYKIPDRLNRAGIVVGLASIKIKSNLEGMPLLLKIGWNSYLKSSLVRNLACLYTRFGHEHLAVFSRFYFHAKGDRILMTKELLERLKLSAREAFRQGIRGPAWDLFLYSTNWGFNLKKIKAKVFLWYGINDKNVPLAMGKYFASQIPGSKLTLLEGGHFPRNRHKEEIIKTLIAT